MNIIFTIIYLEILSQLIEVKRIMEEKATKKEQKLTKRYPIILQL
jgi:hypothetical protein